jgi:hypothetical protein
MVRAVAGIRVDGGEVLRRHDSNLLDRGGRIESPAETAAEARLQPLSGVGPADVSVAGVGEGDSLSDEDRLVAIDGVEAGWSPSIIDDAQPPI